MKTIIVTDIHGCLKQLEKLFAQTAFDPKTDRLICLGDLMDRGPASFGVFSRFRGLKAQMGERCILILGNHEDMMIHSFTDEVVHARWMRNQGQTTLDSFAEHGCDLRAELPWFDQMKPYAELEQFICVHAGLVHNVPEENTLHDLIWDRAMANGALYGGKLVIFGHTETNKVTYRDAANETHFLLPGTDYPLPETGCINMDTGCVYGGKLSALVTDGKTLRVYEALA